MNPLSGREDLSELLALVIEKYEKETGDLINKNTNRENYGNLAKTLSVISNKLPQTAAELQHDAYEPDPRADLQYPNRKYDITGGQLKDAYFGIVKSPRPYLLDACYIYLTGKGRAASLANATTDPEVATSALARMKDRVSYNTLLWMLVICILGFLFVLFAYLQQDKQVPADTEAYRPSAAEIKALEGIWLYYTGAPQARANEEDRYRRYVNNIMEVKFRNGRFEFIRHGASINHYGYMTFNSPGIVSIHSYVRRLPTGEILSPSHSLARLDSSSKRMVSISATWSFESDNRDDIIATRNIYQKIADGGTLEEIENTQQNAACQCKIIEWQSAQRRKRYELRYQSLDDSTDSELKNYLNEESILLLEPKEHVILKGE